MKRILILLFILMSTYINAQVIGADMLNREPKTTVQMNAITVAQGLKNGSEVLNSDTNTIWRYNGTIWEDTGSGLQASDIGVTVQGYNVNTDLNAGDDVTLTGNQTIAGQKTFTDKLFLGNALSDSNIFSIRYVSATPNLSSVQSGHGSLYFQNDGRFTINNGNTTAQTATFDLSGLTQRRDYDLPDASGTLALTSDVTGISNLVEDTTPQLGGDLDAQSRNITSVLGYTGTGLMDIGALGFTFGVNNGVSGQRWNVDTNVSNDIIFNFQSTPTTSNTTYDATPYTLNSTGTPSAATDLIDKAYADANYGGGGSSPPFDDNSPHIRDNLDNTKTITIVADNITTATNRNLTMPNADVDLGNLGAANLDLTATFDWTGIHNFTNSVDIGDYGLITGEDLGVSGRRWWIRKGAVSENFEFLYQISDQTTAGGSYTTFYTLDETGVPTVSTDLVDKAYVDAFTHTDDQTASEVNITDAAGYYTGTDVEAMGQEIGSDLADRPTSLGTGRTNAVQYSDVFGQTLADYNTDGAGGAGDLIIITDASPAEVVATATIAMDGWKMYDDQTADAATITLSDCDPGETLTVYINRASAPTLAGTGLTFNQLPNTTAFASATTMMIIFEVAYDGTTIDYYYVER